MNFFKLSAKIISKISPLLLVAGGVALALAFLPNRRGLRSGAVKVKRGALITKDEVKNVAAKVSAGASDIVKEARQTRTVSPCRSAAAKAKGHRIAVAATAKILTMKEKAQAEFKSIVEEAKKRRAIR